MGRHLLVNNDDVENRPNEVDNDNEANEQRDQAQIELAIGIQNMSQELRLKLISRNIQKDKFANLKAAHEQNVRAEQANQSQGQNGQPSD